MDSIRLTCFSILVLSVSFLFVQGISSNSLVLSAAGSQFLASKDPKIVTIQDNDAEGQGETTEGSGDLPDISTQGNETGGSSTGGLQSGGSLSGTNQTDSTTLGGSDSNQTVQTQNQMTNQNGSQTTNQNLEQTTNQNASQTTNQNVDQTTNQNVNQSTDQNVNVQTGQNVDVETKQKLDLLFVEGGSTTITVEEQSAIEAADKILITQHQVVSDPSCRTGNVLAGVSNAQDLRILLNCQDAIGTVVHTTKIDNGHYVIFLDLDDQYKFLLNDRNNQETAGLLVVEIVPQDQTIPGVFLPVDGDRVHVWGAWVTDKPMGWHEIQPAWKVVRL